MINLRNSTLSEFSASSPIILVGEEGSAAPFPFRGRLIINCILHLSNPNSFDPQPVVEYGDSIPSIEFRGSIVTGSSDSGRTSWSNALGIDGRDNLDVDPGFTSGSFHLTESSRAIDAGTNATLLPTDFDGLPRVIDGDGRSGAEIDIGAFEYLPPTLDSDSDGFRDVVEFQLTGTLTELSVPRLNIIPPPHGDLQVIDSLGYEIPVMMSELFKISVEAASDLNPNTIWSETEIFQPTTPVEQEGIISIQLQADPDAIMVKPREFYRLRFSPIE